MDMFKAYLQIGNKNTFFYAMTCCANGKPPNDLICLPELFCVSYLHILKI